jgi:hypothetical protein
MQVNFQVELTNSLYDPFILCFTNIIMAHLLDEVEDLIFAWILTLPEKDQRFMQNGADIINCISMDAEEDIKNEMWESMKNSISYRAILNRLKIHLEDIVETEDEEEVTDQGSTS